jgi:hypothetical protein
MRYSGQNGIPGIVTVIRELNAPHDEAQPAAVITLLHGFHGLKHPIGRKGIIGGF